jgi:hypothetical protein
MAEFLYATSHITGDFDNPDNANGNTPLTWAGALNTNDSDTSRWAIDDASAALDGTQTIRVVARKGSNSGVPTIAINLYEDGVLDSEILAATDITSTTGQTLTATFDGSAISDETLVEIEVVMSAVPGSGSARNSAQISHIEHEATVAGASPVSVALTPATGTFAAQTLSPALGALATALTPATGTVTAQALTPTPAPLAIALTPATGTFAAQTLTPSLGALETALTPATGTFAASVLSPQIAGGAVEITLVPATGTLTAQALTPVPAATAIELVPATGNFTAQALSLSLGALAVELTPATGTFTASALSPQIAGGSSPPVRQLEVGMIGVW